MLTEIIIFLFSLLLWRHIRTYVLHISCDRRQVDELCCMQIYLILLKLKPKVCAGNVASDRLVREKLIENCSNNSTRLNLFVGNSLGQIKTYI